MQQRSRSRGRVTTAALTLGAAALLTGCAADHNARPVLAGTQIVPAIPSPFSTRELDADLPDPTGAPLTRVDRADWDRIEYVAAFDGVAHDQIWRGYVRHNTTQARAPGLAPTQVTALELPKDGGLRVIVETLRAHSKAIADVFVLPIRAIIHPPGTRSVSPDLLYKRTQPDRWTPGNAGGMPDSKEGD